MVDYDNVLFNAAAFLGGLFVLEYGADNFIDHTAKVAGRLGVSPTLIALLTAGAEWEELAVVVAAICQHRSSLALGNILGSSISNILGAFSLGLIFSPTDVVFDRSAKIYTSLLLALTSVCVIFLTCFGVMGSIGGAILIATFVFYMLSIGYGIYKGVVAPPEDEDDSGSDDELDGDSENDMDERRSRSRSSSSSFGDEEAAAQRDIKNGSIKKKATSQRGSNSNLKGKNNNCQTGNNKYYKVKVSRRPQRSLAFHVVHLVLGFLAISLSGYILSHSISSIADAYSLSGNLVGITILSFATTLPEKLVAGLGGARRQPGIVVANTAGSNIFLLTLCAGVLFLAGSTEVLTGEVKVFELLAVWVSSLLFFGIVMCGGKRWMGWGLLGLYVGFIAIEFTLFRQ